MKIVKLIEVCKIIAGQSPPSSTYNKDGKGLPFFQGKADFGLRYPTVRIWCSAPKKIVEPGDILMSVRAPVGPTNICETKACIGRGLSAIRVSKQIDNDYLLVYLRANENMIASLGRGSTFKAITQKDLQQIQVPLPSIYEQKQIVKIFNQVDDLRQKRKQTISLLNDYLKSIFSKVLDNSVKSSTIKTIEEIAEKEKNSIKSGPFGSSLKKECYVISGYKIYGQEQVIRDDFNYGNYYIDENKYKTLENNRIKAGDILISLVGSFGKISVVPDVFEPGIINPRLMKITVNNDIIRPIFLKELLSSDLVQSQIKNLSHGGTMGIVNVGIMKKVKVVVPKINDQDKYLDLKNRTEMLKQKMINQLGEFDVQFQALMQKSFTNT